MNWIPIWIGFYSIRIIQLFNSNLNWISIWIRFNSKLIIQFELNSNLNWMGFMFLILLVWYVSAGNACVWPIVLHVYLHYWTVQCFQTNKQTKNEKCISSYLSILRDERVYRVLYLLLEFLNKTGRRWLTLISVIYFYNSQNWIENSIQFNGVEIENN